MTRSCFCPGCITGYKTDRDQKKKEGKEFISLFKTPLVWREKKIKPALKPHAIPSIFPNLPHYLSHSIRKRKFTDRSITGNVSQKPKVDVDRSTQDIYNLPERDIIKPKLKPFAVPSENLPLLPSDIKKKIAELKKRNHERRDMRRIERDQALPSTCGQLGNGAQTDIGGDSFTSESYNLRRESKNGIITIVKVANSSCQTAICFENLINELTKMSQELEVLRKETEYLVEYQEIGG